MILRKARNLALGDTIIISEKRMIITQKSEGDQIECTLEIPSGIPTAGEVLWEKIQIFFPDDLVQIETIRAGCFANRFKAVGAA